MIDQRALLPRLRDLAAEKKTLGGDADFFAEAADALEAAQVEIERLREALIELEPLLQKLYDNNKIISETARALLGDTHDHG